MPGVKADDCNWKRSKFTSREWDRIITDVACKRRTCEDVLAEHPELTEAEREEFSKRCIGRYDFGQRISMEIFDKGGRLAMDSWAGGVLDGKCTLDRVKEVYPEWD